jgi:glyoxylase-like metal-dependent hydrolase (beta-lactamase superfamily II)
MSLAFGWKILEIGKTRRDGGAFFGAVPRPEWLEHVNGNEKGAADSDYDAHVNRQNEINLSCNALLLQTGEDNLLIDTGPPMGHTLTPDIEGYNSKLRKVLKENRLVVKDITKIILTSADIDHAGGLATFDRAGNEVPSFPKATVFCYDNPAKRLRPPTVPQADEYISLLERKGRIAWVTPSQEYEVVPGVFMRPAFGPSRRGAVVEIRRGADRIIYLSDLCPTASHLNATTITAYDDIPEATFIEKTQYMDQAEKEGSLVVFSHGNTVKSGYIENTKQGRRFRQV